VHKVSNDPDFLSPPSFILVESDMSFTFLTQNDLPDYPSVQFLCLHICYFLTWTLVKFACLCDVSFAQSGPLTDGRPDSVHIISWQNGVQKYPSVSKTKKGITLIRMNTPFLLF